MQCDAELKRLKSEIKASLKTQALIRDEQQRQLNGMSQRFSTVLNDVFGVKGGGKFRLNGFGLEPEVDPKLAPGGAALSAMAEVLAFDLTCMAASIEGLGSHPRFLIHDSPRSSDIEEPLFHKLFRVVSGWESFFPKDCASFQYIITTTTPPPADLVNAENTPVRLTLSARRDDERLLKFRY